MSRILLIVVFLVFAFCSKAQVPFQNKTTSNLRIKKIPTASDSAILEKVSIIPSTFSIAGFDTSYYKLDYVRGILFWKKKPLADSVLITYRVFPMKLNSVVQRFNFDSVVNNVYLQPFEFNDNKDHGRLPSNRGLLGSAFAPKGTILSPGQGLLAFVDRLAGVLLLRRRSHPFRPLFGQLELHQGFG